MNQEIRLDLLCGAHSQFDVSAMHGIAGLERHDGGPSQASEFGAQVRRSQAQRAEIIMRRRLYSFDLSAHIPWVRFVDGVIGAGVRGAGGTKYRLCFSFPIRLPDIFYMKNCEHHAFGIAQRDLAAARCEFLREILAYIES